MKWIFIVITLLCLSQAFAEKLVIGTSSDDAPFSSLAGGHGNFYGFEIDLMMEVCKRMGAECQFKAVIASHIIPALSSERINLAISAVIVPNELLDVPIAFSVPYFPSSAQYIVKAHSSIHSPMDLKNKRVGIRLGTLYKGMMFKSHVMEKFDGQINPVLYLTMNDLLYALTNDQVDAVFSNAEPLKYWALNNSQYFRMLGQPQWIGDGYAVLGSVSDKNLMRRVSQAITKMKADGTYGKIYNLYFS